MKLYVAGISIVSAYITKAATELRIAVTCQALERSLLMPPQKKSSSIIIVALNQCYTISHFAATPQ
jgi:hypothetical protein